MSNSSQDISPADEKYLFQRAYNARRGKQVYEEKISRSASRNNALAGRCTSVLTR